MVRNIFADIFRVVITIIGSIKKVHVFKLILLLVPGKFEFDRKDGLSKDRKFSTLTLGYGHNYYESPSKDVESSSIKIFSRPAECFAKNRIFKL